MQNVSIRNCFNNYNTEITILNILLFLRRCKNKRSNQSILKEINLNIHWKD